jgi:4-hydroxythreonine-4-phosphate dehydrogenase
MAVEGCVAGRFAGLVTAPLQKSVINEAGIAFTGHTEYLAELTGTRLPVMLLVADDLRVALASTHLPLRDVADSLTRTGLRDVLQVLLDELSGKFGIESPEVIVCGLNPHAGEGGHLGDEDEEIIAPVIDEFVTQGYNVRGPLPADTAFTPVAGHKDAVLAMYHDQGLPVLKFASFGRGVNVTLGLPIIRTSVDHGTALDIAGSGQADNGSLLQAVRLAASLAAQ